MAFSRWNIYHIAAGATAEVLRSAFTIGLVYAFGREDVVTEPIYGDLDGDREVNVIPPEASTRFRRITGLIGFTIGF
jgi:hypothetical protein